jgi:hypothetical protein
MSNPWTQPIGGMRRVISGIDSQPLSFSDTVRSMRLYDAANMNRAFVDVAGTNSISAFEEYQQPGEFLFRPSIMMPAGRSIGVYSDGLRAASQDQQDKLYTFGRDEGRDSFPYNAPSLKNYQIHGQ